MGKIDDIIYILIGIENQTEIHYAMVIRNMLYDALNYYAQVDEYARRHKNNGIYLGFFKV